MYFRGIAAQHYQFAVLIVTPAGSTPPTLQADGIETAAERLGSRLDRTVWHYTFSVHGQSTERGATYAIGERTWRLYLPGDDHLRIAFTACNGLEEGDCLGTVDPNRNERWRHLGTEHARSPFHLLIQGGDQIYADDVWREVPYLAAWRKRGRRTRVTAPFPPEAAAAAADFYFDHYCRLWAQQDIAPIVASIPSLMMWDDHDIFDGWGSHSPDLQHCPVFLGLGAIAREHFALFQLAASPNALPAGFGDPAGGHFGWSFTMGGIGILAPDLRSERTRHQVLSESSWLWLNEALEALGHCRRVFLVSTVPVLNVDLSPLERMVAFLPAGRHLYQDDFRDQWRSYGHRQEWQRLLACLLDFSQRTQTPVTILSGEIHLGAAGFVERDSTRIYQLISSGIVHHAPPQLMASCFDLLGRGTRRVAPGTQLRMLPLPGLGQRYLAARNWLALECPAASALQAQWHSAGRPSTMEMIIA